MGRGCSALPSVTVLHTVSSGRPLGCGLRVLVIQSALAFIVVIVVIIDRVSPCL